LPVKDPEGRLLGATLPGVDKDGYSLPQGFGYVALPAHTQADSSSDAQPGDVLMVRFAPRLLEGGSLLELLVVGGLRDLGGLHIEARSGHLVLPSVPVTPGSLVWVTDVPNALVAGLHEQIPGRPVTPTLITWGTDQSSPEALAAETHGRFQFARSGGSVSLVYGDMVLDQFAYGDAPPPDGWQGENVEATRIDGRMYLRAHDGDRFVDTDTAADWQRPRIHRQHQSDHETTWFTVEGPARAYVCPDRCHEEVTFQVHQAQASLDVNLYELTLPSAVESIADAARRGVDVRVLVHDRPVAASASRMDRVAWAVDHLVEAGAEVRTLSGTRYDVNHAKYLIIDDAWTIVLTENAVQRGWPPDGQSGNRGHGISIHDARLAAWMTQVFETDHLHPEDSKAVTGRDLHPDLQPLRVPPEALTPPPPKDDRMPTFIVDGGFRVMPVLAPDHLGDPAHNPVVAALLEAEHEIGLAQMNLPLHWSRAGHRQDSPLVESLYMAAGRGLSVTGTLAGAFIQDPERDGNHRTAAALHMTNQGVDLRLGGAPHPGGVVHAKTWWIDPGEPGGLAITGSANGNLASQAMNREVGLVIAHPGIAAYWAHVTKEDHARASSFIAYAPERTLEPIDGPQESPGSSLVVLLPILLVLVGVVRLRKSPPPDRL
jgi:phosphatidylserine/phosphatidylglycerophosphate/cardiolipin synthase-like enzyme